MIGCIGFRNSIITARGRLSHSTVGDKSQVQDTGSSGTGSGETTTESRIKPRSR